MNMNPLANENPRTIISDRSSESVRVYSDGSVVTGTGENSELRLPPRAIGRVLPIETLSAEDRAFYGDNSNRADLFAARSNIRKEALAKSVAITGVIGCMDGRQVNLTDTLGLERGVAYLFSFAGSDMGEPNGRFDKFTLNLLSKAAAAEKIVAFFRVMHFSSLPGGAGCAAWKGNYEAGHQFSINNCIRDNLTFNLLPNGGLSENPLFVSIPLSSDTYTRAITFHGPGGKVSSMTFVQHDMTGGDRTVDAAALLEGEQLRDAITKVMRRAFPIDGKDFPRFRHSIWEGLISQMSEMCYRNVEFVRASQAKGFAERSDGHRETRVLIGRGWDMYPHPDGHDIDDQLMVNDFNFHPPVNDAAMLAVRFALANRLEKYAKGEIKKDLIEVPVYINIPYDRSHLGQFGIAATYADELTFSFLGKLRAVKKDLLARTEFRNSVEQILEKRDVRLPALASDRYKIVDLVLHGPMDQVRVITSLSDVATTKAEVIRVMRLSDYEGMLS